MKSGRAFVAGFAGAVAMSLALLVARALGVPANIGLLLGTIFGWVPSIDTWTFGTVLHLLIGGLVGLVYGWVFENLTHGANGGLGARIGAVHAIVAGLTLGLVPTVHPGVPLFVPAPGAFMANFGFEGVIVFALLHLLYGTVVGSLYGGVDIRRATN